MSGHREDAVLYAYWTNLKAGFDSTKILRWLSILIVLPIAALTILALPMHVILGQAEIRDCGYAFRPCQVYRYSDARRMTIIDGFRDRNSRLTRRAGIVIDFSDGRRWSSADIGEFNARVTRDCKSFLQGAPIFRTSMLNKSGHPSTSGSKQRSPIGPLVVSIPVSGNGAESDAPASRAHALLQPP
jgi:hypothetical protein